MILPNGDVAATILVNGFVAGKWRVEKRGKNAVLRVEFFDRLSEESRAATSEEGERLLQFMEPYAEKYEVVV